VDAVEVPPNLAVSAAHRATVLPFLAAILPLLPPTTRNVTLPRAANRLECGIREESAPDAKCKSGKNGNVDHPSQHQSGYRRRCARISAREKSV
jgi:hypothetical protein